MRYVVFVRCIFYDAILFFKRHRSIPCAHRYHSQHFIKSILHCHLAESILHATRSCRLMIRPIVGRGNVSAKATQRLGALAIDLAQLAGASMYLLQPTTCQCFFDFTFLVAGCSRSLFPHVAFRILLIINTFHSLRCFIFNCSYFGYQTSIASTHATCTTSP